MRASPLALVSKQFPGLHGKGPSTEARLRCVGTWGCTHPEPKNESVGRHGAEKMTKMRQTACRGGFNRTVSGPVRRAGSGPGTLGYMDLCPLPGGWVHRDPPTCGPRRVMDHPGLSLSRTDHPAIGLYIFSGLNANTTGTQYSTGRDKWSVMEEINMVAAKNRRKR
eukprot:gene10856-biopygen4814